MLHKWTNRSFDLVHNNVGRGEMYMSSSDLLDNVHWEWRNKIVPTLHQ